MQKHTSSKLKKAAILVSVFLLISIIVPFVNGPSIGNISTAADEMRFTKGAKVAHPALGDNFISWIEYREGAYNLYSYNFQTRVEKKLNKVALASDTLGPVVFQNYVYWIDHAPSGWVLTSYDLNHETYKEWRTEVNRVFGFNVYEKLVVYSARVTGNQNTTDVFVLNLEDFKPEPTNITNDENYQAVPSIFGDLISYSEYPLICSDASAATLCQPSDIGSVMAYQWKTKYESVVKEKVASLSDVATQQLTLVWSQMENGKKAVKVYYFNTGTSFTVSPTDYNSYNPVFLNNLVVYFVDRVGGTDLDFFQFGANTRGTLSWRKAVKSQITISPANNKIAWVDDRLGSDDIFYYDFNVDAATNDQDIDGLSDADENKYGTNAFNPDTDNDGLTDWEEVVRYKTFPTQYDTDADGLSDGKEVLNWSTSPVAFDSDKDGYSDFTEIANGYDPNDPAPFKVAGIYGQERLKDLSIEWEYSIELQQELHAKGVKTEKIGHTEWNKMVNAYIYGGYNAKEILAYAKGNKVAIHDSISAEDWRGLPKLVKKSATFKTVLY
jgi:hypothetical protein